MLYIGRDIREKGEVAADVEAADQNGKAGARKVEQIAGARELIGLHADEAHDRLAKPPALGMAECASQGFCPPFVEQVTLIFQESPKAVGRTNIFR